MSFAKEERFFLHSLQTAMAEEESECLSKQAKVWQEADNRVHVQKSILLYCFGKVR